VTIFVFVLIVVLLDIESVILSDGDEFADDNILMDLRGRRAYYLGLLKQLDDEIFTCRLREDTLKA
jgi:hypothetical protein